MTLAKQWQEKFGKSDDLKDRIYNDIKHEIETNGRKTLGFIYMTRSYSQFSPDIVVKIFHEIAVLNGLVCTKRKIPIDPRGDGIQHYIIHICLPF